jgi:hypothetical protein
VREERKLKLKLVVTARSSVEVQILLPALIHGPG